MTLLAFDFQTNKMYSDTTVSIQGTASYDNCKITTYKLVFKDSKYIKMIFARSGSVHDTVTAIEVLIQELIEKYNKHGKGGVNKFKEIIFNTNLITDTTSKKVVGASNIPNGHLLMAFCISDGDNKDSDYECFKYAVTDKHIKRTNLGCFKNFAIGGGISDATTIINPTSVLDLFIQAHNKSLLIGGYIIETDFLDLSKSALLFDINVELAKQTLISNGMDKKYIGIFNRKHSTDLKSKEKMYKPVYTKIDLT